jgi:polyisoprenoid-binding protein YceI
VAEVTSLEVTEGRGGVKALTAADRSDIKVTLERILEASSFPMIEFQSIHVNGLGGRAEIDGELSIRGTKAPARLYATLSEEADRLEVVGEATVAQSRFGIKPYTAFLGALRVRDAVQVSLEAELIPLI